MTPAALWSIEFVDNHEHDGGAMVVLYRNRVLGGNNAFTYIGEYSLKGDIIHFDVQIKRFKENVPGIYKDNFRVKARGKYHDLEFIVTGSPDDDDDFILAVKFHRQHEINY